MILVQDGRASVANVVYDTYYAVGVVKTRKGSLIDFRDNGKLKIGEELFD